MALAKNGRLLFNEPPKDFPIPGRTTVYDDTETIDLDCVQLDGGILIKTLYLLADPYLRERMEEATIRSDYSAPFHLGKPYVPVDYLCILGLIFDFKNYRTWYCSGNSIGEGGY